MTSNATSTDAEMHEANGVGISVVDGGAKKAQAANRHEKAIIGTSPIQVGEADLRSQEVNDCRTAKQVTRHVE